MPKLRPTDRYTWERVLERAELPTATKTVGLLMAMKGNTDGSRVRPGQPRLAAACNWSTEYIAQQIKRLQAVGMLECVRQAAGPKSPAVYRLTLPGDDMPPVPMRLDPDGVRLTPKKKGRGGTPTHKKTRTPVPVFPIEHPNSSSGVHAEDPNSSWGEDGEHPNSSWGESPNSSSGVTDPAERTPQLEFGNTPTGVREHPNSSSPNQIRPILDQPVSGSYLTPTSRGADSEPGTQDRHEAEPADLNAAYRSARRLLDNVPAADRNSALAQAAAELSRDGVIGVRPQVIRAAEFLAALAGQTARTEDEP